MSFLIPLVDVQQHGAKFVHRLEKELEVTEENDSPAHGPPQKCKKKYGPPKRVRVWTSIPEKQSLTIPYAWATKHFSPSLYRPKRTLENVWSSSVEFIGTLRQEQQEIFQETLQLLKTQCGSACVAVYPGGGKTITSLCLSHRLGLRVVVLLHRLVLVEQWRESIQHFFTPNIRFHFITTADKMIPKGMDIYLINAINVPKWTFQEWSDLNIGTVLVDECHVMVTNVMVQALSFLTPRYILGLSATPYRPDGLNILLEYYFGHGKVIRKLFRPHQVMVLKTGLTAPDEKDEKGQRLWNPVLEFQACHEERNRKIVDYCSQDMYKERNILVLCKRRQHIELLRTLFEEKTSSKEEVGVFYGDMTTFPKNSRILLASFQKVGVGFSHNRLDMLVLGCDCEEYFLQYLGRVFRRPDVVPIVIDVVDVHSVLQRHAQTRKRVYRECGGKITIVATNK
uniref:Helicase ATP-binding domain-containing protein n=1 Tax=viral metagenome TaxID=1070528 RepID=A0A6C0D183_9ZZZZ